MPIQIPKPTPPDQLSQDTLDLYKKAINEPGLLTEKDVLIILEWVSKALADERCCEAYGSTWEELITIAVETPQELTSNRASFLHSTWSPYYLQRYRRRSQKDIRQGGSPGRKKDLW